MQDISHIVAKVAARNYTPDDVIEKLDQSEYDRLKELLYQIGDNSIDYTVSEEEQESKGTEEVSFDTIDDMTTDTEEDEKLQELLDSTTVPNTTPTDEFFTDKESEESDSKVNFDEVFEKLLEHAANEDTNASNNEATSDFITGSFGSLQDNSDYWDVTEWSTEDKETTQS